jgi:RNA polymerase sigma-70 factor (ECF subfamily)
MTANEVSSALGLTLAAARSALQRARATLAAKPERVAAAPSNPKLVDAYVSAWNSGDVKALIGLLHRDVVVTMPPWQRTFRGSAEFGPFLIGVWPRYFAFRAVATQANGQDAIVLFSKAKGGELTPHSLHVLGGADGEIDEIILYAPPLGGALLAVFDWRSTTH